MSTDPAPQCGQINRRGFVLLAAAAAAAAGCGAASAATKAVPHGGRVVDAGPAGAYAREGVYAQYRALGFFLIRRGGHLTALSAICTHRHCKLEAEQDRTFFCPCHDSTFDPAGKVTQGPAKRDLPVFPTSTNAQGHLLVYVTG